MPVLDAVFGCDIPCACGRTHRLDPHTVLIADNTIDRLDALLADICPSRRIGVVADRRSHAVAGAAAVAALRETGWRVRELLVSDRPGVDPADWHACAPVCDDHTRAALEADLGDEALLLAVGSGVINDLTKWLAHDRDLPYAVLATAASMNGYTSANVAATVDGVKTLLMARPPQVVAAAMPVVRSAPWELTAAGLGDILAKSVSSADWILNHRLFGDYFCQRSVELVAELEPLYLDHPEELRQGAPAASEALFTGLLLTGGAMTMAGTSSPASGGEHMVSHTLDMMSSVDGGPHDLHGRQVGVSTVIASALYRRVLAVETPIWHAPDATVDTAFWGPLAPCVQTQYEAKGARITALPEQLAPSNAWDDLRTALATTLRPPERLRDCLRRAEAAWRVEDLGLERTRLRTALAHAHEIRSRFTILDLARALGILPAALDELVDEWA